MEEAGFHSDVQWFEGHLISGDYSGNDFWESSLVLDSWFYKLDAK
jgi:hypothetical protein